MLAKQFLDLFDQWQPAKYVGLEDLADKLNFLYTPIILTVLMLIVTAKSYVLDNIACYSPTVFSGKNFDDYLVNYCWVHGTIPLKSSTKTPTKIEEWGILDKEQRISYYQWVPFFLGLQIILFYIPRLFWQVVCYNRMGTDLESVITTANNAVHASTVVDRDKHINFSANILASMFYQHKDYRSGKIANLRRRLYEYCNLLIVSKRMGTWIVVCYLFTKILYTINGFGQLYIMRNFLGLNESMTSFGLKLTKLITDGETWEETLIFPRTAMCHGQIRQVGAQNNVFNAICALPVNMLNEKVFIFLWFWYFFIAIVTFVSIPLWFFRISLHGQNKNFIRKHLRIARLYSDDDEIILKRFVYDYMHQDGVFIIRMMSLNAGDLVTGMVLAKLWEKYRDFIKQNKILQDEMNAKTDPFDRMMMKLYGCQAN